MIKYLRAFRNQLRALKKNKEYKFLKEVNGLIHVGANTGQEIALYAKYNLSVIWIEPIEDVFNTLSANLKGFPKQHAIKALVTDVDNKEYEFNVANNGGASSSIFDLNQHKEIWPDIKFDTTISLFSKTLTTLIGEEHINVADYNMLVMDTQGSELLVLKGAIPLLPNFTYIKTEVPDFESYKGCCQLKDIESFLATYGFEEIYRNKFASSPNLGSYYDIIYKKKTLIG
jgi:FkbM family methyltransferase